MSYSLQVRQQAAPNSSVSTQPTVKQQSLKIATVVPMQLGAAQAIPVAN